jgi:kynurenine formamidase
MGRALYVNLVDLNPNSRIAPADMERACGSKLKEGDIVILDSPYHIEPFTEKTNTEEDKRLFINREVAQWLADRKVKCVGFGDGVSIENSNEDVSAFHDVLMAENIVFLEVLKNLDKLQTDVFFMSYSPLPIMGLDSSPVRAYAIEGLQEFSD